MRGATDDPCLSAIDASRELNCSRERIGESAPMSALTRGATAVVAALLTLVLGVSSVAAAGATLEVMPLDDRWSHEEPDGSVYWFDVTGEVRIVTSPDGRQSATVQMRQVQTLYDASGRLVMEAESSSSQHALSLGEDTFQVHVSSRSRWSSEYGDGSSRIVLQIVNGVAIVDHQR